MGFGGALKAGSKYKDPRATVSRQERQEEPRRTRVVPVVDAEEPPQAGSVEAWNVVPSSRLLKRSATERLRAITGSTSLDNGMTQWKRNARKHNAFQCLLKNAKSIPALRNVGSHELAELAEVMGQLSFSKG